MANTSILNAFERMWQNTVNKIDEKISEINNGLSSLTAQVGQTIIVKTIDENGRPTSWECVDLPTGSGLPPITAEDEGKILRVVNSVPTWVSLPHAEEGEF